MLSIVVPVKNEEKNVRRFAEAVLQKLEHAEIACELIFVDDGSDDHTWGNLRGLCLANPAVKAARLSRNFGKEGAMFAGLSKASGDYVAVMDCDFQHPLDTLLEMYWIIKYDDVDIVQAKKKSREKESVVHRLCANMFYYLLKTTSGIDLENATDFRIFSRKALDALDEMPERQTFFRAMSSWIGFRRVDVYFEVPEREIGSSKWSLKLLFKLAFNAITSYSSIPMQLVTVCGVIFLLFSLVMGIQTLYMKLSGKAIEGFTTVILILLIMGSIIMLSLGIIGLYLARILEEIKFRPRFIISEFREYLN